MDKAKFIDIFNSTTHGFEASLADLHAVLEPFIGLSEHPRLSYAEASQLYSAWRMCSNVWEDAYDEGREHGFSEGYDNGHIDGLSAND